MRLPKDCLSNMPTGMRKGIETLKKDIAYLYPAEVEVTHLIDIPTSDFDWEDEIPIIYVYITALTADEILSYYVFAHEGSTWREVAYVNLQTKPPFHTPEIWRQGRQVLFRADEPPITFPAIATSWRMTFLDEIRRDQERLTVERQQQFLHELAGEAAHQLSKMIAILKHDPEYTREDLAIALSVYLIQLAVPDDIERPSELPDHVDELVKATSELYLYDTEDETEENTDPQEESEE